MNTTQNKTGTAWPNAAPVFVLLQTNRALTRLQRLEKEHATDQQQCPTH
jgi:hypothetical protein